MPTCGMIHLPPNLAIYSSCLFISPLNQQSPPCPSSPTRKKQIKEYYTYKEPNVPLPHWHSRNENPLVCLVDFFFFFLPLRALWYQTLDRLTMRTPGRRLAWNRRHRRNASDCARLRRWRWAWQNRLRPAQRASWPGSPSCCYTCNIPWAIWNKYNLFIWMRWILN